MTTAAVAMAVRADDGEVSRVWGRRRADVLRWQQTGGRAGHVHGGAVAAAVGRVPSPWAVRWNESRKLRTV